MKYAMLLIGLVAVFSSCRNASFEKTEDVKQASTAPTEIHPGKKLMETHCYLCHSPHAPEHEGRVGPPMIAIKAHYLKDGVTQAQFTQNILNFLNAPDTAKARLKDDVRRYGLMPYQQYSPEVVQQIAEYMYRYQIAEPEWFATSWEKKTGLPYRQPGMADTSATQAPLLPSDIGLNFALETKKVLGQKLMQALQAQGAAHALEFCNTHAIPITDSMARHYQANIRRVSDKPRNPGNQANAEELKYIEAFKKQVAEGREPMPVVLERNGIAQFYYPITTNTMCLQCHGKPAALKPEVAQKIAKLYPTDKATGYSENEVRGIWSIQWKQ